MKLEKETANVEPRPLERRVRHYRCIICRDSIIYAETKPMRYVFAVCVTAIYRLAGFEIFIVDA
jgi:hypothetical protein